MMSDDCKCKNKEDVYVCVDTPTGVDCTPVDKAPDCFDHKVSFYKTK